MRMEVKFKGFHTYSTSWISCRKLGQIMGNKPHEEDLINLNKNGGETQRNSRLLNILVTISPGVSFPPSPRSLFLFGVSTRSKRRAYCRAQFLVEYQSGGRLASLVSIFMFLLTATLEFKQGKSCYLSTLSVLNTVKNF